MIVAALIAAQSAAFGGDIEVASQTTDPLSVNNATLTSTLIPAFTIAAGDATSAIVDWASLTHGSNVTNCTTVVLRTPNLTNVTLKADGVPPILPYNVLSTYNGPNGGPGTYVIVLTEDSAGGCNGSAVLTGVTMTVSAVVAPAPPVGDGLTGAMMRASRGAGPDDVNITFDVTSCSDDHAVVLWGNFGNFTGYQNAVAAGCSAGGTGTASFNQSGSYWFNVLWVNSTNTAGHPGNGSSGPRTWTAAGLCGVTADDHADDVCDNAFSFDVSGPCCLAETCSESTSPVDCIASGGTTTLTGETCAMAPCAVFGRCEALTTAAGIPIGGCPPAQCNIAVGTRFCGPICLEDAGCPPAGARGIIRVIWRIGSIEATRQGWSKGNGGCDESMKLRLSSCGCESRPVRGEPAQTGSQPCSRRGDVAVDA